jgi:ribosome-binding protein aMBF1 (putative translation factor)
MGDRPTGVAYRELETERETCALSGYTFLNHWRRKKMSNRFGKLVKDARKEKGLSLVEVATELDTHKGYISGIENGKVNPPSVKFIKAYSRLFGFDTKEMIFIAHMQKAPEEIQGDLKRLFKEVGV